VEVEREYSLDFGYDNERPAYLVYFKESNTTTTTTTTFIYQTVKRL